MGNINSGILVLCGLGAIGIIALIYILFRIIQSPFSYPYKTISFDVSGRRSPKIEDLIDNYINKNDISPFLDHYEYVEDWKRKCQDKIAHAIFKRRRERQFLDCLDDKHMFQFIMTRSQKRYRQKNYVKSSYYVDVEEARFGANLSYLQDRYNELKAIGFACTLSEYNAKEQRKLMTKELRDEIAARDNYTCQICGKYMPDGVGLHIDHIVPIAKGGKSVPSNLQVLCSKCNGRKSAK